MSDATFNNWSSKHGGLGVSQVKRRRTLETQNAELKWLLANAMLDNGALKDLLEKMVTPATGRGFVGMEVHETRHYRSVSVRRVDRLPMGPSTRLPSQAIVFGLTL